MLLRLLSRELRSRSVCFMSDTHGAPAPNDPPTGTPPATPATPAGAPAPAPIPTRPAGQTDAERAARLEVEIANTRAEAASYRVDGRQAKEKIAQIEAELATVRAEANRRIADVESAGAAQLRAAHGRIIDAELKAAAAAAGLVDTDLLPLIPRASIVYNQDGSIAGIPEAIANFKTSKPQFFRDTGHTPAPAPAPAARATGASGAPAPAPAGAAPAAGTSAVKGLDKNSYDSAKADALSGLRRSGR